MSNSDGVDGALVDQPRRLSAAPLCSATFDRIELGRITLDPQAT